MASADLPHVHNPYYYNWFLDMKKQQQDRGRGQPREIRDRAFTKIEIQMSRSESGLLYDVLIRSALPPHAALWNGSVDWPLRPQDERELQWAADQTGFNYRDAVTFIRETDRIMRRQPDDKRPDPYAKPPEGPTPRAFKQR